MHCIPISTSPPSPRLAAINASSSRPSSLCRLVGGHTQGVNSVCFSLCSEFVVTGGEDMKCAVWERVTGNLVGYLDNMHTAAINCVRFSCKVCLA